jgi:ERCC4-related helicase
VCVCVCVCVCLCRAGLFNVLVATDVAARGIDVPEVALVVQTKVVSDFSCLACSA